MDTKQRRRKCRDCKILFPFAPRKVRCMDCYKKYVTKEPINPIDLFIPEDD